MYKGRLLIAKIQKSVGFNGEVKAELLTDFPERFKESFVCAVHKDENPDPEYFLVAQVEEDSPLPVEPPKAFRPATPASARALSYDAKKALEKRAGDTRNDAPAAAAPVRLLRVKRASLSPGFARISFAGIESKEQADPLRGCFVSLDPSEAKDLPEGRWYKRDLFDLEVYDATGQNLGKVKDILSYPASDLIQVGKAGENDLLIPFVESMVKEVDLDAAKIIVDLPEGFVEVYRS